MKISTDAIVSNSEMIKRYKACRDKAEGRGKIFILKNNQLDAVLISAAEYEKLSILFEYIEKLDESELDAMISALPFERIKRSNIQ